MPEIMKTRPVCEAVNPYSPHMQQQPLTEYYLKSHLFFTQQTSAIAPTETTQSDRDLNVYVGGLEKKLRKSLEYFFFSLSVPRDLDDANPFMC
jgi:hypothetical protein